MEHFLLSSFYHMSSPQTKPQTKKEFLEQIIKQRIDSTWNVTQISAAELAKLLKWPKTREKLPEEVRKVISAFYSSAGLDNEYTLSANEVLDALLDQYPQLLEDSIATKKASLQEQEQILSQWKSTSPSDQGAESITEALLDMKTLMKSRHKEMKDGNKLPDDDFQKLLTLPLTSEVINGVLVVNRPWFGKFGSSNIASTHYADMFIYSNDCSKWRNFANPLGAEVMSLDDIYTLMTMIAKKLWIFTSIDQSYINKVHTKYPKKNVPLDNELGRVLRALSIIIGSRFVGMIVVKWRFVRTLGCYSDGTCCFGYEMESVVCPPFKVRSSSAA